MGMPARGKAAFSIAIRLASASIIRCRSAHLVEVRSNHRLLPVSTMRRAQQCRIPHAVCRQQTSHAPHGSKARLQDVTNRRRFMAKPCTPHLITRKGYATSVRQQSCQRLCNAQRVQLFELQSGNVGGRGVLPSPFSGGSKGGILFGKRIPPLPRVPTAVGQNTAPLGHPKREYSFRCMNKKRSTNKRKLRITYHEQNENRYDHCLRTA